MIELNWEKLVLELESELEFVLDEVWILVM